MLGTQPDGLKRIHPRRITILAITGTVATCRLTALTHALAALPLTPIEVVQASQLCLELGNLLLLC